MALKVFVARGSVAGRVFFEAENYLPTLRICVVSDGHPSSVAWLSFNADDIAELKTALDAAICAMQEPVR